MNRLKNQNKYLDLRRKYPFFEFQSYSFKLEKQTLEAEFVFNISDQYYFKPGFKIPSRSFNNFQNPDKDALSTLVFHIGMVELISYWKATCSPKVIVRPHTLPDPQIAWWKKLYFNGLGEFFYLNGIDAGMEDFMHITTYGQELKKINLSYPKKKVLVPVGGGKDSVVTIELLRRGGADVIPMILNPREAAIRTISTAGFKIENAVVVERWLDKKLLELNEKGYLNGHTPFSSLLAFINLLVAASTGIRNIALSNESSASESTVPGTNINHQYSKSVEFENDFREYYKKYIDDQPEYFSFLRPLNELQIAELFSGFPSHFDGFRSCNVGSKTDSWCGKCPKCLFTYLILSPFISQADLHRIFGMDLFNESSLQPIMDELTGKTAVKPFECVGTTEEVKTALWKSIEQYNANALPVLLKNFVNAFGSVKADKEYAILINQFDENHNIPPDLLPILKDHLSNNFQKGFIDHMKRRFDRVNHLLILGFGREGQSTFRLLKDNFQNIELAIADRNESLAELEILKDFNPDNLFLGEDYLDAISHFQRVIKSPGVNLSGRKYDFSKITSQTELFLEYYRSNTIGVTGTKGKSTTVSLIHHLLNKAGKENVLLGNIGVPAFDRIELIKKDTIVVFELSAHQLQYIQQSPGFGVLLNIFPEHLDHFEDFDAYRDAKTNLFRYQDKNDVVIIHESIVSQIDLPGSTLRIFSADDENGGEQNNPEDLHRAFKVSREMKSGLKQIIGKHNENNILAAVLAVSFFGIPFEKSIEYLSDFIPLPHRLEYAGMMGGVHFYNDSISTIPESAIAAVKALEGTDTLILGGFDRGLDYSGLIDFLLKGSVRNIIFMGQVGKALMPVFQSEKSDKRFFFADELAEAFPLILKHTTPGSICLLSPAASSYDQFHNFEHRGDTFKSLVRELKEK